MKKLLPILSALLLITGCKTESGSNNEEVNPNDFLEALTPPQITLGYIEEPAEPEWRSCDSLLENDKWTCNVLANVNIGSGTKATVTINETNVKMYYTVDGTEPTVESLLYNDGIEIARACNLKVIAFNFSQRKKSKVVTLNIEHPYGRTLYGRDVVCGDGYTKLFVCYLPNEDGEGINFSLQHYCIKLDDGNTICYDGVPAEEILKCDPFESVPFNDNIWSTFDTSNFYIADVETIKYTDNSNSFSCWRTK